MHQPVTLAVVVLSVVAPRASVGIYQHMVNSNMHYSTNIRCQSKGKCDYKSHHLERSTHVVFDLKIKKQLVLFINWFNGFEYFSLQKTNIKFVLFTFYLTLNCQDCKWQQQQQTQHGAEAEQNVFSIPFHSSEN